MAEQQEIEKKDPTPLQETSVRQGGRRDQGKDGPPWRVEGKPAGAGDGPSPQMGDSPEGLR